MQMCDRDIVWCQDVMELKAGLLTRNFRSSVFCRREELLLVQTSDFLNFNTI